MSICRVGDESEVYVYKDVEGGYTLHYDEHGKSHCGVSKGEMLALLERVHAAGLRVPPNAFEYFRNPGTPDK